MNAAVSTLFRKGKKDVKVSACHVSGFVVKALSGALLGVPKAPSACLNSYVNWTDSSVISLLTKWTGEPFSQVSFWLWILHSLRHSELKPVSVWKSSYATMLVSKSASSSCATKIVVLLSPFNSFRHPGLWEETWRQYSRQSKELRHAAVISICPWVKELAAILSVSSSAGHQFLPSTA